MDPWYTDSAVWSAVAAFGALVTAAVIAVNAVLDRRERREHACRANVVAGLDYGEISGAYVLLVQNRGPWHAADVTVQVRPPDDGVRGGRPWLVDAGTPDGSVSEPILPAGGKWWLQLAWPEGWSEGRALGLELRWREESGRRRHLSVDVSNPDQPI